MRRKSFWNNLLNIICTTKFKNVFFFIIEIRAIDLSMLTWWKSNQIIDFHLIRNQSIQIIEFDITCLIALFDITCLIVLSLFRTRFDQKSWYVSKIWSNDCNFCNSDFMSVIKTFTHSIDSRHSFLIWLVQNLFDVSSFNVLRHTIVSHLAFQSTITYDFHLSNQNCKTEWTHFNVAKITKIDSLSQ